MTQPISLASALAWQLPSRPKQQKNMLYFLFSICQPGEGTWSSKPGKRKIRSIQLHLQNLPYSQWCGKIYPLLIFQEGEKVYKCANWFILALSPYQQQNVMLAPASSLPLGSVQAPCCSANRLFVAMLGNGKSLFPVVSTQLDAKAVAQSSGAIILLPVSIFWLPTDHSFH